MKRNFFVGRGGEDIDEVNRQLSRWVREVADARVHGTTRRVPGLVFAEEEQRALIVLPARPFELVTYKHVRVYDDSHVHFDRRCYSVPWRLCGQKVWVRATDNEVLVFTDSDERVATQERRGSSYRSTSDAHLPTVRAAYRHRSPGYWIERADAIGEHTGAPCLKIFGEQRALSKLPMVQRLVLRLEAHPVTRAEAACRRALYFGSHGFVAVKRILKDGLDAVPLPGSTGARFGGWTTTPRFARDLSTLFMSPGVALGRSPT